MYKLWTTVLLVSLLSACAVSPTGRQQFIALPSSQLQAMGAQAFAKIKREKPIETQQGPNAYVRCVANAITRQLDGPQQRSWEVVVFEDESPNAFALPGGKIGVHTGLLDVARNEDQLAAVIGHEVGHVLAEHGNERMSQQLAVQGGMAAAGALSGGMDSVSRELLMRGLGLGAQVGVLLPYSRVHESEADVIGLDLMARAGFDPRASVDLWRNMAAASEGQPLEFLSTHPAHESRIQNLQSRMGQALDTYEQARRQGNRPNCG